MKLQVLLTESERVVQETLDKAMVHRTAVLIAHRPSTIREADSIAVVKNGVINVEKGRHEVLVNITNGAYAALVGLHFISHD